jgi:hypothetical protein
VTCGPERLQERHDRFGHDVPDPRRLDR